MVLRFVLRPFTLGIGTVSIPWLKFYEFQKFWLFLTFFLKKVGKP